MATRLSYGASPMRPALGARLPARTTVMPIVMVGALTALLLLLPLTLMTVAQHSARQSAVSAAQAVPTDAPTAPFVPQPVEDRYVAPLPAVPDLSSHAVAEEQAPFTLVSSPDTQGTDGQQGVEPDSVAAPALPPQMAPALRAGEEPGIAPAQQDEEPATPLSQVSAPPEPAPQVIMPVQPAPAAPPPAPRVETTSQQSSTQSSPAQSKRHEDREKGAGARKGKRD